MNHLYVHIPFCRSRCAYCDFASEPVGAHARAGRVEWYFEALRAELTARLAAAPDGAAVPGDAAATSYCVAVPGQAATGERAEGATRPFETIYLGGGTPTVVAPDLLAPFVGELAWLLRSGEGESAPKPGAGRAAPARAATGSEPGANRAAPEFTIEANPGTIDARLLQRLAEAGATRLSLGIQSFAPALRAALGRRVTQREIEEALAAIAATGWEEWNLDLIFGIPGETWETAAADIDTAVAAGPSHISLYDLTYTPAFCAWCDARSVGADEVGAGGGPVEAASAFSEQHYGAAAARLEAAGYRRYEVSNFALPGHECRHNQAYWRGQDYLGIGASAVSTIGAERLTNPRSVRDYLAGRSPDVEILSPGIRLFEKAMLGLRTSEGIDEEELLPALDPEALRRLLGQGCLERCYGRLRLNKGFLDVSNAVIAALLVHPGGS